MLGLSISHHITNADRLRVCRLDLCVCCMCMADRKNIGTEPFRRREFIYSHGSAKIIEPPNKGNIFAILPNYH